MILTNTDAAEVDAVLAQIAARGLRRTPACRAVITALHKQPWLTAREVHDRLAAAAVRADLTTAHRVLRRLTRAGVIVSLSRNGAVSYRIAGPVRHCLVCQDCDLTVALPPDVVTPLLAGVASAGFDVDTVMLSGRCPHCAARSSASTASSTIVPPMSQGK